MEAVDRLTARLPDVQKETLEALLLEAAAAGWQRMSPSCWLIPGV